MQIVRRGAKQHKWNCEKGVIDSYEVRGSNHRRQNAVIEAFRARKRAIDKLLYWMAQQDEVRYRQSKKRGKSVTP